MMILQPGVLYASGFSPIMTSSLDLEHRPLLPTGFRGILVGGKWGGLCRFWQGDRGKIRDWVEKGDAELVRSEKA